jgi:hypothetical protein
LWFSKSKASNKMKICKHEYSNGWAFGHQEKEDFSTARGIISCTIRADAPLQDTLHSSIGANLAAEGDRRAEVFVDSTFVPRVPSRAVRMEQRRGLLGEQTAKCLQNKYEIPYGRMQAIGAVSADANRTNAGMQAPVASAPSMCVAHVAQVVPNFPAASYLCNLIILTICTH